MISKEDLKALKTVYEALVDVSPFSELEDPENRILELEKQGLVNYKGGSVSMTPYGEKCLRECLVE